MMSREGNPFARLLVLFLAVTITGIGIPAAATLVLTGQSFAPDPPLVPGDGEHAAITVAVLPSGGTTFTQTHTLQMQTGLSDARWDIRVIANGRPAAQQSASGTSAFVNGYLLSYPVTSDVSLVVTINGTVPSGTVSDVTVLQVTELDTSGQPVPGGTILVTAPVVSPSAVRTERLQETQSSLPATLPSSTRAGCPPAVCLGAVVAGMVLFRYAGMRR